MAVQDNLQAAPRTAFYNDPVIRGIIYQVVVAVAVVLFLAWIIVNTAQNLAAQNKSTGFDFLFQTSGFGISFSLIPFDRSSYYWEVFLVGLLNTLLVAVIGIFLPLYWASCSAWLASHPIGSWLGSPRSMWR